MRAAWWLFGWVSNVAEVLKAPMTARNKGYFGREGSEASQCQFYNNILSLKKVLYATKCCSPKRGVGCIFRLERK